MDDGGQAVDLMNIADTLFAREAFALALEHLQQAAQTLGDIGDHPKLAVCVKNIAACEWAMCRAEAAIRSAERAASLFALSDHTRDRVAEMEALIASWSEEARAAH